MSDDSNTAILDEPQTQPPKTRPVRNTNPKPLPPYQVVLLDDDDHSYDYVVEMLTKLFGVSAQQAFLMACEVDATGEVIVDTTTKERAEFKRDQIRTYGPDRFLMRSKTSMRSVIRPVETE